MTELVAEPDPPSSMLSTAVVSPPLPHSASAPAAIPTVNTLQTSSPHPLRSVSIDAEWHRTEQVNSPEPLSRDDSDRLGTTQQSPRKITPTSSNASSPQRTPSVLPPAMATSRRDSNTGLSLLIRPRLGSAFRRPSFATSSIHSTKSESPSDSTKSHTSLRYIGEGALDDSDSSGSDIEEKTDAGESSKNHSDEERQVPRAPRSPYLYPRNGTSTKSPLSHVVGQQAWSEDEREEDGYSPSPASSESESSDSSSSRGPSKTRRRISGRGSKSRSRSSTVASLMVSSHRLERRSSQSSIRTVTLDKSEIPTGQLYKEDTIRLDGSKMTQSSHHRTQSGVLQSDLILDTDKRGEPKSESSKSNKLKIKRAQHILESEKKYREIGWEALRDSLESFADEV